MYLPTHFAESRPQVLRDFVAAHPLGLLVTHNRAGAIVPGSFVRVGLTLKSPPRVQIPSEAVFVRDGVTLVATVGEGSRLKVRRVKVIDDDARRASVEGLEAGQEVALDLGVEATEGQKVRVVAPAAPGKKP